MPNMLAGGLSGAMGGAGAGFAFGGPLGAAIGGGVGLLGGLLGSSGNSGQEDYMNKLNQMYGSMPSNYDSMIQNYYRMAGAGLQGQQAGAVRDAGNRGYAQSASMNLSNPMSLMNRYVSDAYGQYAGQFGNLATSQAGAMYQGSQDAMRNKLALLQMMGGPSNAQFNFARDMGPGLMSLGGSLAGAALNRPQMPVTPVTKG
jgi:hypothetical protein